MKADHATAARLELASTGILDALAKAGMGEDHAEMATALGVAMGCLAHASAIGEPFLEIAMGVARATLNGEVLREG